MWNSTFKNKPRKAMKRSGFKPKTLAEVKAKVAARQLSRSQTPNLPPRKRLKGGKMQCTIPKKLRVEMAEDPFYKQCCITGRSDEKIEWHHNLIFGGKRINEKFCILPLTKTLHDNITYYKEECDWIMLNRATDEEIVKYSKAIDYQFEKERLNKIYGEI